MATITPVNRGTSPGDGTGDTAYVAFGKVNTNDTNLNTEKLERDGSIPLTANWDVGSFSLTMASLNTDTINEETLNAGVTIDGVLVKDNDITTTGDISGGNQLTLGVNDTTRGQINLYGAGAGVGTGGIVDWYQSADYDTNYQAFRISAFQGDFVCGTDTDVDAGFRWTPGTSPNPNTGTWNFQANAITTTGSITGASLDADSLNIQVSSATHEVLGVFQNNNALGAAELQVFASSQGDGYVFAGQSALYGGGMVYRGDATSPTALTNGADDHLNFFARNNGVDTSIFSYAFNGTEVDFKANDITTTGNITSAGISDIVASGNNFVFSNNTGVYLRLYNSTDTGGMTIAGGNDATSGGGLTLYGGNSGTLSRDILFAADGATELYYDDSASSWNFQANDITTTGLITANGGITMGANQKFTHSTENTKDKIRVWGDSNYTIGMKSGFNFGYLGSDTVNSGTTDYAMTFQMNASATRGFHWGDTADTSSTGAMSLTTDGKLYVNSYLHAASKFGCGSGFTGTWTGHTVQAWVSAGAYGGSYDSNTELVVENNGNSTIQILSPNAAQGQIWFGDPQSANVGYIVYQHSTNEFFFSANGIGLTLSSSSADFGSSDVSTTGLVSAGTIEGKRRVRAGISSTSYQSSTAGYVPVVGDAGVWHPMGPTTGMFIEFQSITDGAGITFYFWNGANGYQYFKGGPSFVLRGGSQTSSNDSTSSYFRTSKYSLVRCTYVGAGGATIEGDHLEFTSNTGGTWTPTHNLA